VSDNRELSKPSMFAAATEPRQEATRSPGWPGLLGHFYAKLGLSLPAIGDLDGPSVPEPYRGLLVHSSDMTPTLEGFYGQPMRLNVLTREHHAGFYHREVLLKTSEDSRPVEYGVIRICLNHLPEHARTRVLEEQRPLGNILQTESIAHLSWPQAFFQIESDSHLGHVLFLTRPGTLYGRRNVLLDGSRRLLAEVIEILAPAS
jgi:chorismate-pyruvate lyase